MTPLLAEAWGLAARVQGRERYYALMFDRADGGRVRLVSRRHDETVLAERTLPVVARPGLCARACGLRHRRFAPWSMDRIVFEVLDRSAEALDGGGVALIVDTGSIATEVVRVNPL